jgi:hypothetical protein
MSNAQTESQEIVTVTPDAGAMPDVDKMILTLRKQRDKLKVLADLRLEIYSLQRQALPGFGGGQEMKFIVQEVALEWGISSLAIFSGRRFDAIALPRHVVFYLARELTELSLNCIGGIVGGRDHGTVIHGVRHVKDRMDVDPAFKVKVERARTRCKEQFVEMEKQHENRLTSGATVEDSEHE